MASLSIGINLIMGSQSLAFSLTPASNVPLSAKTSFENESNSVIFNVLYARPSSAYQQMSETGANQGNRRYATGDSTQWYIEEQRFGKGALISGLLHNDQRAIDAGLKMFDWGFSQQLSDGSFGSTEDAFHSTSMFVESVAYSLLVLQTSPNSVQYTDVVAQYIPALQASAHWMIQDDVWTQGLNNNAPYTHRSYVVASALGLTGKLTGDQVLIDYANQALIKGLVAQRPDGVNPEKGGHDSSYQMSGVGYAMRWLVNFATDHALAPAVTHMLNRALLWEESRILATGAVSSEGNTRTPNQEISRSGDIKALNHREIIEGFAYSASVTEDIRWQLNALQVASYYYADDLRVMAAVEQARESSPAEFPTKPLVYQSVPENLPVRGLLLLALVLMICDLTQRRTRAQT